MRQFKFSLKSRKDTIASAFAIIYLSETSFMALLEIIEYPHPTLKQVARDVDPSEINETFRQTLDDMVETMLAAPGVGLAAPQVNISKRFLVIDVSAYQEAYFEPLCFINPVITERSGTTSYAEGCLSLPEFQEDIERDKKITVNYLDRHGKPQSLMDEDFLAIVLQHEIDHLDGIVAVDRVSPMKKMMYIKKLKKLQREEKAMAN